MLIILYIHLMNMPNIVIDTITPSGYPNNRIIDKGSLSRKAKVAEL